MSVKLRMTRIGRHKDPIYRIVAADGRYARDGRIIEQIGYVDPSKSAESVIIDEEKALKWLNAGAQPSDSIKTILIEKGIYAKYASSKAPAHKKSTKAKKHDFSKKPAAPKKAAPAKKAAPSVKKEDVEGAK